MGKSNTKKLILLKSKLVKIEIKMGKARAAVVPLFLMVAIIIFLSGGSNNIVTVVQGQGLQCCHDNSMSHCIEATCNTKCINSRCAKGGRCKQLGGKNNNCHCLC